MVENKYYIPFNEVSNIANRIHVCLQAFSVFQIADFRRNRLQPNKIQAHRCNYCDINNI